MNIALFGFGKMGKEIEKIALERGHQIALIISTDNYDLVSENDLKKVDVAIEFLKIVLQVSMYVKYEIL
jgi:4-hydroxy-tetrahydrodipicolinate reductase